MNFKPCPHLLKFLKNKPMEARIILLSLIFILLCGCNKSRQSGKEITDLNLSPIKIDPEKASKKLLASDIYAELEYIALETNENSLIGDISQVFVHGERFYLLDEEHGQSVLCFSLDGSFLFRLNREGSGPGEYTRLTNISIDYENDYLVLHCGSTQKMIFCDLDGNYQHTKPVNFSASKFSYIGNNRYAFFCEYGRNYHLKNEQGFPNLIFTDDDFNITKTLMYFPESFANPDAITMLPLIFSRGPESITTLMTQFNDTIYHINGNEFTYAYHMDFGENNDKSGLFMLLNKNDTQLSQIQSFLFSNNVSNLLTFLETDNQLFFSYQRNRDFHFASYLKNSDKLIDVRQSVDKLASSGIPIENNMDGGPFSLPLYSDGKNFYGLIYPYALIASKDKILEKEGPMGTLIDKVTEMDNPIIVKIVPKS